MSEEEQLEGEFFVIYYGFPIPKLIRRLTSFAILREIHQQVVFIAEKCLKCVGLLGIVLGFVDSL